MIIVQINIKNNFIIIIIIVVVNRPHTHPFLFIYYLLFSDYLFSFCIVVILPLQWKCAASESQT